MPRPRNTVARAELSQDIKAIARQQLADNGTNGISLRGIARELGITAPAIYNYFPKLDDLITALLIDAFTGHADAIEAAIESSDNPTEQLMAGLHAYRNWAVANPSDFQLIYGNPLPSYDAPSEITIPLASRPQELFVRCLVAAQDAGQLHLSQAYQQIPSSISDYVKTILYPRFPEIEAIPNHLSLFYIISVAWSRVHGIVMLEIHKHLAPAIGDVDTFFAKEMAHLLEDVGIRT